MDQNRTDMPLTEAADAAAATTEQATPATRPAKGAPKKPPRLLTRGRSVFAEYGYLLIAAGVPAALFLLVYIAQGLYPLDDYSVLSLDLNAQYIGFYHALRNFLHGDASLLYSFSRNLGGEFLGTFAYYVASPLACIVALFPETRMLEALLTLFTLKTALMGLTMGFYLHKHSAGKPNHSLIVAFSTMYALCSYAIAHQTNSMFIDALIWLPLLTYGLEELIKKGHFRLFTFALAITVFSNYYIGYMVCIYVVAYSFYYYFAHNRSNENNPMGEKSHFIKSVGRVVLWSAVAICITAMTVLAAKYSLSFGKNDFSSPDWSISQKFDLFLLPYKMLPSSYDTVRPAGLPFLFCGTLTLLMAPAYFLCKKFSDREKIASGCFILLFVLSFAVSSLDLIWHGFQKPNWLNYRYSFLLCFFLLVLAFRAMEQIRFLPRKALVLVTAAWAFYILVIQELDGLLLADNEYLKVRPFATVWLALGCLLVYFVLTCVAGRAKRAKHVLSTVLVFVVVVEMFLNTWMETRSFVDDVGHTGYSTHNNYFDTYLPIAETIRENDPGFYRAETTYHRQKNDNFILQFKGINCSTSTLNREVISFLETMGYYSASHKSVYNGGNPVSDSILGIKYLVTEANMSGYYGEPIYKHEDIQYDDDVKPSKSPDVYLNPYALSLAFGVADDYADFHLFTEPSEGVWLEVYSTPLELYNDMITAMLGSDERVEVFKKATQTVSMSEAECSNCEFKGNYTNQYAWSSTGGAESTVTFTYDVPTGTELFFYLPDPTAYNASKKKIDHYRYEVGVSVNGKSKGSFFGSEESTYQRVMSLGTVSSSEMKLELKLKKDKLYVDKADANGNLYDSFVYYIDKEVLASAMTRLQAMSYQIDEGYTDDHLTGSISTEQKEQLIATTIPYDEGWKVYVDGERVETFRTADALLGFRIDDAGSHTLEMKYLPNSIAFGMVVSALATVAFILVAVLYRWLRRLPVVGAVFSVPGEPLPVVETPESRAVIAPGDIGDDPPEIPPVSADAPEDIDEQTKKKNTKKKR